MNDLTHLADGALQALLDDELPAGDRAAVDQHMAQCASCREHLGVLAETRGMTRELLGLLDAAPLALTLPEVVAAGRRARRGHTGLIAASILLLVAAVASATVGRPYVRALVARIGKAIHPQAPTLAPVPVNRALGSQTGIAFVPGATTEIGFDAQQDRGVVLVSLADTGEVILLASAPVPYRVYPGGIAVHNQGSDASYDLVVPQSAGRVRVVIAGRLKLEKVGTRIDTAAQRDTAGRYALDIR